MIICCHHTLITTNLCDCDIKCIHVSFLDVLTLFLRNRWYQALLNNYSWENVTVVPLMQPLNIHELMSFGFHLWGSALTKQSNGDSQHVGCRPGAANITSFTFALQWEFSFFIQPLYIQKLDRYCAEGTSKKNQKRILPFHLPENSWTNNPTKWSGVSHPDPRIGSFTLQINQQNFIRN